jgi:DNA primase
MPGVDFRAIRAAVSIAQVLELVDFQNRERAGDQLRGGCPVPGSSSPKSRSFSANLTKNTYPCFKCGSKGNALDLWAAATQTPWYEAAITLCGKLNLKMPCIQYPQAPSDRSHDQGMESEKRNS